MLEGTGATFRHVKLRAPKDVENPALRARLEVAITNRVPPPPRG